MFVNRYNALKEFVDYVNNVVKKRTLLSTIRFDNPNKEDPRPTKIDKLWDSKGC